MWTRIRGVSMLLIALACTIGTVLSQTAAERASADRIASEHRFTAVESSTADTRRDIAEIKADLKELKSSEWMKMLVLVGLLSEAGFRNLRRAPGKILMPGSRGE